MFYIYIYREYTKAECTLLLDVWLCLKNVFPFDPLVDHWQNIPHFQTGPYGKTVGSITCIYNYIYIINIYIPITLLVYTSPCSVISPLWFVTRIPIFDGGIWCSILYSWPPEQDIDRWVSTSASGGSKVFSGSQESGMNTVAFRYFYCRHFWDYPNLIFYSGIVRIGMAGIIIQNRLILISG